MAILFVAAEADELKPFAAHLTALRKLPWPLDYAWEGILAGRRLMLVANGAGPSLAANALEVALRAVAAADLSSSNLEAVVSVGFCGALQPGLQAGSIIVPAEVQDAATGDIFPCADLSLPAARDGRLLSQNRVACTAAEKAQLGQSGALAVEMEASGVALRANKANLPFSCIKVVSDRVEESFGFDLNAVRSSSGRIVRGKIVNYALTHPALIPELFRLRRRAQDAARALGEFLVSCRIQLKGEPALTE